MSEFIATTSAFDATASEYASERAKLIPGFDMLYGAAIDLVRDWGHTKDLRILDLGAGTGLFSSMVARELPGAFVTLLDGSAKMLDEARASLRPRDRFDYRVDDMALAELGNGWDLIISSLAIHHLEHADKRALFSRIFRSLNLDGLFINVEQVSGPDDFTDQRYARFWERDIRANGATEKQIGDACGRMAFDKCASVEDQLEWMREAGFQSVDCSVKVWRFGVLHGSKRKQ